MSDDRSAFDPRFDPAFQRGYDGPAGEPARTSPARPAPEARTAPVRSSPDPRTMPVVASDSGGDPAAVSRAPERMPSFDDDAPDEERRRVNPWFIALAALSAALILGGLYLVSQLRDLFANTQNSADFDYVVLQVMIIGAPILIGLGIATAIGLLFALALRRR